MTVMIGVDPHKGSHAAVAIDGDEVELATIRVWPQHLEFASAQVIAPADGE